VVDKELYKTAYEIHPNRQIDIAAAFQESVDQSVSKSIYIDERLRDDMEEIYLYAWKKKLKSTYYCFIDKVVKGEKYTEEVNKRGSRKGFGASTGGPSAGSKSSKTDPGQGNGEQEELVEKAREKFGDERVEQVLNAGADECPTDPMLRRICPSCE
jgi:ribonucleoside-diphosphate reductase alpha chain